MVRHSDLATRASYAVVEDLVRETGAERWIQHDPTKVRRTPASVGGSQFDSSVVEGEVPR